MTETPKKAKSAIAILDWAVAIVSLLAGIVLVFIEWPSPSIWSWLLLVVGVVGMPLAYFNPLGKLQTWMLRRMVKRR